MKIRRVGSILLHMVLVLASFGAVFAQAADEPTFDQLARLLPRIDSTQDTFQPVLIRAHFGDSIPEIPTLTLEASFQSPEKCSLVLRDERDGTPLVVCSGRKMILYDPVTPCLYYSEDAGFSLEHSLQEEKLRLVCDYRLRTSRPTRILLDLHSLLAEENKPLPSEDFKSEDSVNLIQPGVYQITRSMDPSVSVRFEIEPASALKVKNFELVMSDRVVHTLDEIKVHPVSEGELFVFPDKERLAAVFPLNDVTTETDPKKLDKEILQRNFDIRSILGQPKPLADYFRDRLREEGKLDLEDITSNDQQYSKLLREFFPQR